MAEPADVPPPGRGGGRRPRGPRATIKRDNKGAAAFAAAPAGKTGPTPAAPGSYSPVFPVSVLDPCQLILFGPDFISFLENSLDFVDCMVETDIFNKIVDHATQTATQRTAFTQRITNNILAGACLAAAQSIIYSHKELTGTTGNTTSVYRPASPLPINLRVIADQMGELDLGDGKMLRFKGGHIGPVARILRAGNHIRENGYSPTASAWAYYPASTWDESLDVELAIGVHEILKNHPTAPLDVLISSDDAFSGAIPQAIQDIHSANAYSAADWLAIQFFYGARPGQDATMNVAPYWHLIERATGISRPPVGGPQPVMDRNAYHEYATSIVDALTRDKFYLDQLFSLADSSVHDGRVGSLGQLSTIRIGGSQITLRTDYPGDSHSMSLSAIYHIGGHFEMYETRERSGMLMSVMTLTEIRSKFVRATMAKMA